MEVGLDKLLKAGPAGYGRVAWLANGSAVTTDGLVWGPAAALEAGFSVSLLLVPEHGAHSAVKEGEHIRHGTDDMTGLPFHSLYNQAEDVGPSSALVEALAHCDTIVIDIADIGARYSTYIATTKQLVDAASQAGRRIVVLDRPNLLGRRHEGPGLAPGQRSFVGVLPVPIRHGLTVAELVRWYTRTNDVTVEIEVLSVGGWHGAAATLAYAPYLPPSPNLNCLAAQLLYLGTCLVEGTNLSEGRGTANPFQLVGAPWMDASAVLDSLRTEDWPGVLLREVRFVPLAQKHAGCVCRGIFFHVVEPEVLKPIELGARFLSLVFATSPEASLRHREGTTVPVLDQLWGSGDLSNHLSQRGAENGPFQFLAAEGFGDEVQQDLLYG